MQSSQNDTGILIYQMCCLPMKKIFWGFRKKNISFILLQGEGEHNKGEVHNELHQLGKPEIIHPGDQRVQQGKINLWTDIEGQGGRSERPAFRLQKGIEWVQEV